MRRRASFTPAAAQRRRQPSTRWLFLVAALTGCASWQPLALYESERRSAAAAALDALVAADPGPAPLGKSPPPPEVCPAPMEGATLVKRELPDGVAIDFQAGAAQDIEQVREHARDMTWLPGTPFASQMGEGHSGMFAAGYIVPVTTITTVEDIPRGARITFRPRLPSQLEVLKERSRASDSGLPVGDCPVPFPRPGG